MTEFFNYPLPGWYAQYYNPYNETDLQAPFVFNFSGQPWKAQRVVRRVLRENYLDAPDGIPGNDDCGAMSSWAVLSMMGIYSVDPASLAYELVGPTFPKIVIHLQEPYPGKTFTIETTASRGANAPTSSDVTLNGQQAHAQLDFISRHSRGRHIEFHAWLQTQSGMGCGTGRCAALAQRCQIILHSMTQKEHRTMERRRFLELAGMGLCGSLVRRSWHGR